MSFDVYLGLGSNIGDREAYLMQALTYINNIDNTCVTKISGIYETEPVGYADQGRFLNMAVKIFTEFEPEELLGRLQAIEILLERYRDIKWGPRTIDIDILLYGDRIINTEHLTVPHPRMLERAFVLIPLKEIYPADKEPGCRLDALIDKCNDKEGIRKYKDVEIE